MKIGSEEWLRARGVVWCWWSPGEPEDDLHGFVTKKDRDDFERGKLGPFKRIVRDHHKLGPVDPALVEARKIMDGWKQKT